MSIDKLPVEVVFAVSVLVVLVANEVGYRLGRKSRGRSEDEKESPVSAMGAAILGLTAFMLALTFGMATDRFDARKGLVREEANAIRTAFSRSDFLPEADRAVAKDWLRAYVMQRVLAVQSQDVAEVHKAIDEAVRIQHGLWDMAVVNARRDMNSDVAALYIEALNDMTNVHALRVAVGMQARIPALIWQVLYVLVFVGMLGLGYQTAIAGSGRSWATPLLAISFSLVIALVAALDRPNNTFIKVSQQPLVDVRTWMSEGTGAR